MYSLEQKQSAVQTYNELYSYRKTIQVLGYPGSRNTLKLWVHEYSKNGSIEETIFHFGFCKIPSINFHYISLYSHYINCFYKSIFSYTIH